MRRYPLRGAKGAELANIRPNYNLKVATKPGRACAVASINLHIKFTMTLPRAARPAGEQNEPQVAPVMEVIH